jgi:hypothetical protein
VETGAPPPELGVGLPASEGQLTVLPVLHGRLELAIATRQALDAIQPDCVAVELPETLEKPVLRGVARLPLLSVLSYRSAEDRPIYLPIEPADPFVEAIRWALERKIPCHLVDQDVDAYGRHAEPLPDPYAVKRLGYPRYAALCEEALARGTPDPVDAGREETMAFHLRRLRAAHRRVVFVCGLAHARPVQALLAGPAPTGEPLRRVRREAVLHHLAEASSRETLAEPAYLSLAYEEARSAGPAALDALDRLAEEVRLCQRARAAYQTNTGEEATVQALSVLFRFARNYALVEGRLAPDLYQLLTAARGAVDDNFAYEVFELATRWPHQSEHPGLPVLALTIEDLYQSSRYLRFHRTQRTRRHRLLRLVRERAREKHPGEWKRDFKGDAICSYPPEDVVIESYGDFLKKRAKGMLSAEQARTLPFTSSLLDGIDLRETLRNWHEGRLYVREARVVRGEVGAVVVVFDEDRAPGSRYPWTMTWQGEHEQESDMAFYATALGEQLVGPGISRCEYGGFLLCYPPGRVFQVFEDPYFDQAESKPERLLLAAIDYSLEKLVLYVGPRPPRSLVRGLAERFGKRLVYVPLGDLSPVTLKQIRAFHVLDGHRVRAHAKRYIW